MRPILSMPRPNPLARPLALAAAVDYDATANPREDRTVFLADDGDNSNSFTAGALEAVGLEVPGWKFKVPGYYKLVPEAQFKRQRE